MAKTIPQLTDATTVNAADELIIQQGGITKRATITELEQRVLDRIGIIDPANFASTSGRTKFWVNQPASGAPVLDPDTKIVRVVDRLMVGGASTNAGFFDQTQNLTAYNGLGMARPWVEADGYMGYFSVRAQMANYSTTGTIAYSAASRSSDNLQDSPLEESTGGFFAYCRNDKNNPSAKKAVWPFYGHAVQRYANSFTTVMETETFNLGPTIECNPYLTGSSGTTAGLWVGCGGESATFMHTFGAYDGAVAADVNPVSVAIAIVNQEANIANNRFSKGIVFGANAIAGTDGATGTGTAIQLARGHEIVFNYGGDPLARSGTIRSDSNDAATQQRLVFGVGSFKIKGVQSNFTTETTLFEVAAPTLTSGQTATNYLAIIPTAPTGGAAEIAAAGADSNIDIRLSPKGSAAVRFGTHVAVTTETVTGYIFIKDAAGNSRKLAVVS